MRVGIGGFIAAREIARNFMSRHAGSVSYPRGKSRRIAQIRHQEAKQ